MQKTSGSLVEVAKVPTVDRPTHFVHEPRFPPCKWRPDPIRHHPTVRTVVFTLSLERSQLGRLSFFLK